MSYLCFGTFFTLICANKEDWDKGRKPAVSNRVLYFALLDITERHVGSPRHHVNMAESGNCTGYTDDIASSAKNCKKIGHPIQRDGSVEMYRKRFQNEHAAVIADFQSYIEDYLDANQLVRLARSLIELIKDSQADEKELFYIGQTLQDSFSKEEIANELENIYLSGLLAGVLYYILDHNIPNNSQAGRDTLDGWKIQDKSAPDYPVGSSIERAIHVVCVPIPAQEMPQADPDTASEQPDTLQETAAFEEPEYPEPLSSLPESGSSILLIENSGAAKDIYRHKMEILRSSGVDNNWQYNELLIKQFVMRRCRYYGSKREYTVNKVKRELLSSSRNLILTGKAGVGKSTVLKWLYTTTRLSDYKYLYLTARMFANLDSLAAVCEKINGYIDAAPFCLVFFDGLDELRCVKGTKNELEAFLRYFENKSSGLSQNATHRFIITTRPEHFAFHNAVTKPSRKNLDKYAIYEILPLNYQEALKICLSIKIFCEHDNENNLKHFIDKWPSATSSNDYALSEREYKKQLKNYLYATSISKDFMLAAPLLCRYAYQIVCNWIAEGDAFLNSSTLSLRLKNTMHAYIKWEFHDEYDMTTESETGRAKLEEYTGNVFEFLTEVASEMLDAEYIERGKWEASRQTKKIGVNAAFCILQENENGNLTFVHKSFKDYFLARFYVKNIVRKSSPRLIDSFIRQTETNLDFIYLYAELLMEESEGLLYEICSAIAAERHIEAKELLSATLVDYLLGKTGLYYREDMPFTIHDYLDIFPFGKILYIGKTFDRPYLKKLERDRVLTTSYPELLQGFHASAISNRFTLRGIQYTAEYSSDYQIIDTQFGLYLKGYTREIGGYWSDSLTAEDIARIARKLNLEDYLEDGKISCRDIIKSGLMDRIRQKKRQEDQQKKQLEESRISQNIVYVISFLNPRGNYWYLFHREILFVCEAKEENRAYFTEYYNRHADYNLFDFQTLYCHYRLRVTEKENFFREFALHKLSELKMVFDSETKEYSALSIFNCYYDAHWKNVELFEKPAEELLSINGQLPKRIVTLAELLNVYREADQMLSESPNELAQLILSDEKLITYYLFGQGEEMTQLAQETLESCRALNHPLGENLRLFLINDETVYTGEDRKKVEDYAREYIWY